MSPSKFKKISFNHSKTIYSLAVSLTLLVAGLLLAGRYTKSSETSDEVFVGTPTSNITTQKTQYSNKDFNPESEEKSKTAKQARTTAIGNQSAKSGNQSSTPIAKTETKNQVVILQVDAGTSSHSYTVTWSQGMNVYDVMEKARKSNEFSFEAVWYEGVGSYYITKINDIGCCWIYKINGKNALGVSLEIVEPGDVISWKHI